MGPPCAIVIFGGSLFLSFLVIHQRVMSDLVCKPMDSESLVNETTYFNCSSSITAEEIHWYHYPVGVEAHERKTVYAFGKFYKDYEEDFVLEKISSNGAYNLVIQSVKPGYAGQYECQEDRGYGNSTSAQLIVLDDGPECNSDIDPDGVIGRNTCGIQPEELHLSCSISYHGNIPPELKWIKLGENDSIYENVTTDWSANRFTYNLTVKADLLKDKSSFECQTTKSRTSKHNCTSETVKLLHIFNASSVFVKNIGEVINCSANTSSQSCQYKWNWNEKNYTSKVSDNRILKINETGQYRCEATCDLRDIQCTVNAILINATLNSSSAGSVTINSGGSSATAVLVSILVVVLICVLVGVVLFIICRQKHGCKDTGLCQTLEAEERGVEVTTPLNEVLMQDLASPTYEEKTAQDGTNPVTENSTEEACPLLQNFVEEASGSEWKGRGLDSSPFGTTTGNPIIIPANSEEEHPGKRTKTGEPKKEETDFDLHTELLHVVFLKSEKAISGLTVLDKQLFIAYEKTSEVKVFQAIAFSSLPSFEVMDLDNPIDMVSCSMSNCLYISSTTKIFKVDTNGKVIAKWPIEDGGGTLSVTYDQTVILSDWKRTALREYSADGKLICEVRLPSEVHPFHAVKIRIDQFVVSYEHRMVQKVSKFETNGTIIQSFSGMLKFPKYLVVKSDGWILVADQKNSRVLMINPNLESSKVILLDKDIKDKLYRPSRIWLDEENCQMYVADNKAENQRSMIFRIPSCKTGATAVNQDKPLKSSRNLKEDLDATAVNQDKPLESNRNLKEDSVGIEDNSEAFADNEEEEEEFHDAAGPVEESRGEKRKR